MKIAIIGAGNVATHLSQALQDAEFKIVQVYSRTKASAKLLALQLGTDYTNRISQIKSDADIYFYCVKDSVLPEIIQSIEAPDAIHIHTSGSTGIDVYYANKTNFGVLYPLQTFSKNKTVNFAEVPVFIEGSSKEVTEKINEIAKKISSKIYFATSDQRLKLHISAVFACNFTNYMYDVANEILKSSEFPFEVLLPLIEETADKIKFISPFDAQTGPAVRFDENIISKHVNMLKTDEEKQNLYQDISKLIFERHRKENEKCKM